MSRGVNKWGYCECGCGQKTNLARDTNRSRGTVRGEPMRFLQGHHTRHPDYAHIKPGRGPDNPAWGGGRHIGSDGYVSVYSPEPGQASVYRQEHVVLAERAVGGPLPADAQVHHVNVDRSDNSRGNLVICQDAAYHKLLHRRARAAADCGDPNQRKCSLCGRYDSPDAPDLYIAPGWSYARHRSCFAEYMRERRAV